MESINTSDTAAFAGFTNAAAHISGSSVSMTSCTATGGLAGLVYFAQSTLEVSSTTVVFTGVSSNGRIGGVALETYSTFSCNKCTLKGSVSTSALAAFGVAKCNAGASFVDTTMSATVTAG